MILANYVYFDKSLSLYRKSQSLLINPNYIVTIEPRDNLGLPKEDGLGQIYVVCTVNDYHSTSLLVCSEELDEMYGMKL